MLPLQKCEEAEAHSAEHLEKRMSSATIALILSLAKLDFTTSNHPFKSRHLGWTIMVLEARNATFWTICACSGGYIQTRPTPSQSNQLTKPRHLLVQAVRILSFLESLLWSSTRRGSLSMRNSRTRCQRKGKDLETNGSVYTTRWLTRLWAGTRQAKSTILWWQLGTLSRTRTAGFANQTSTPCLSKKERSYLTLPMAKVRKLEAATRRWVHSRT